MSRKKVSEIKTKLVIIAEEDRHVDICCEVIVGVLVAAVVCLTSTIEESMMRSSSVCFLCVDSFCINVWLIEDRDHRLHFRAVSSSELSHPLSDQTQIVLLRQTVLLMTD